MNPVLLELRERRKLNYTTGLCIEHASGDPLPQIKDDCSSSPGVCKEEIQGKRNQLVTENGCVWQWQEN